jgi:fatty-acyl-CoA synthase
MEWLGKTWGDLLKTLERTSADRVFVRFKGDKLTYGEFLKRVDALATSLLDLGIQKGEHIILIMPNCLEWLVIMFAIQRVGAVLIPLNTRYKTNELDYLFSQSDATTVFIMDKFINIDFTGMLYELCPEIKSSAPGKTASLKYPHFKRAICLSRDKQYPGMFDYRELEKGKIEFKAELEKMERQINSKDVNLICYTTGTTSFPKGVMHRHNDILQHAYNCGEAAKFSKESNYLAVLPFFGVWGVLNNLMVMVHQGGLVIQDFNDPSESLRLINEHGVTHFFGTDGMYMDLLNLPELEKNRPRTLFGGMTALLAGPNDPFMESIRDKLGIVNIVQGYGLSEANSQSLMGHWSQPFEERMRWIGHPNKGVEIKLVDPLTHKEVGPNQEGEIWIKSYIVMKGYYNKPKETSEVLDAEGWLRTGDLGIRNEKGLYNFRGRYKDIYKQSGFNVSPAEVEETIIKLSGVEEVYVVGIPDPKLGEVGMAYIKKREGAEVCEAEIIQWCKKNLANFKVPHYIRFVSEFPRITAGAGSKVQKYKLREMGIQWLSQKREENK